MGELAAIATAILWAFTSIFFSEAGKRVGSFVLNRVRLILASLFLLLTHLVLQGVLFPANVEPARLIWLSLSGVIGLTLGDVFLFQAYIMIGPRITTLIMAMAPVLGTILAWFFLGEILSAIEILGICITLSAIAWVVIEKRSPGAQQSSRVNWVGILYAVGAVLGQAVGLILSKVGLADNFPAISGVLIRILAATAAIWIYAVFRKEVKVTKIIFQRPGALQFTVLGSLVGPYLGVWFSLIAVQLIPVGIASTLMSITPIIVLPLSRFVYQEKISYRALLGTVGAFLGLAIISLVK